MADVKLEGINKAYGSVEILRDINLEISHGEFVVFVGPSGSGKSTLLRMIGGLERITSGRLSVDNRTVNDVDAADRNLSMVFQNYALYPHMTVGQNMAFPLEMAKATKSEIQARVGETAALLQIEHLLDRKPRQLSGGQRQRVAIGRAIVREPKVFLFDEPLSNLDAELRVQMRVQIAKLHRQLGNTMIYVTHDQVEAMTMADKIVVLRAGRIEQVGAPYDLYHHPASQFVAGFIGSPKMNFLDCRLVETTRDGARIALSDGRGVTLPVGAIDLPSGSPLVLGIRPDDFVPPGANRDELSLDIVVDVVEHLGSVTYLYGAVGSDAIVALSPSNQVRGKEASASIAVAPRDCYLFSKGGVAFRREGVSERWN
jgi:ABC-type sugar transport system ATPase subunit